MHRASLVASKETGLEVNAEKTKYMFISREHNARKSHSTKQIVNASEVQQFTYLGKTPTNQNFIREEIKIQIVLNLGNAWYL